MNNLNRCFSHGIKHKKSLENDINVLMSLSGWRFFVWISRSIDVKSRIKIFGQFCLGTVIVKRTAYDQKIEDDFSSTITIYTRVNCFRLWAEFFSRCIFYNLGNCFSSKTVLCGVVIVAGLSFSHNPVRLFMSLCVWSTSIISRKTTSFMILIGVNSIGLKLVGKNSVHFTESKSI